MYKLNIKEVTDNKTFIHSLIRVSESLSSKNYQKKPLNPVKVVNYNHGVNETSDFKSEIKVLNDGLNNEYTSNNERIMKELKNFEFTSHKKAIQKMREYFKANLEKLDKESIINDPYLKEINNIWKGK
jgi:GDP-L-fucose synthase